MSNGEVRGRLNSENIFHIKKFKSLRMRKSPEEENLPFEVTKKKVKISSNPFYFGLPQLNIAAIPVLLPSLSFFTNAARRGRIRRKFMAL